MKAKVELFEQIRIAARDENLGKRALAKRFSVHRRDVSAALVSAEPPERKQGLWPSPLTGPYHEWIREVLRADLVAPVKQRHTAKRIRDRLAAEHDVLVGESTCRTVVARLRAEIAAEQNYPVRVFEQGALHMLPNEVFNAVTRLSVRVDTKARVCVRNCFYSVPARYVNQRLNVELGAESVAIIGPGSKRVATHQRALHRKTEVLDLDHYLEVLWKRPGGFPGSTALVQARTTGRFRPEHQQFWDTARHKKGDRDGTRLLCEVLLLHRTHTTDEIITGIRAALTIDSIDPGVIAVEARRSIEHTQPLPVGGMQRPPSLADYDNLLNRTNQP